KSTTQRELLEQIEYVLIRLAHLEFQSEKKADTSSLWNKYESLKQQYLSNNEEKILETSTIYALKIKNRSVIKYIGQTKLSLEDRLKAHLASLSNPRKIFWLEKHKNNVEIVPLEENIKLKPEADFKEAYYIYLYRKKHFPLLNSPEGPLFCKSLVFPRTNRGGELEYWFSKKAKRSDYLIVGEYLYYEDIYYALQNKIDSISDKFSERRLSLMNKSLKILEKSLDIEQQHINNENFKIHPHF
ncbi:MAG: hypothetical protein C0592_10775, partial [Marinilabiliales bacterium]